LHSSNCLEILEIEALINSGLSSANSLNRSVK
jgi:hypothetical protein